MPKMGSLPKNTLFFNNDDDLDCLSPSMKLPRQTTREPSIGPKKNLPHKKRIAKKLKTISPTDDRMHAQTPDAPTYGNQMHVIGQHDIGVVQNYAHSDRLNRIASSQQHQTTSLNLTMNAQPIQLTTTRVDPAKQHTQDTAYSTAHSFADQSLHSVHMDLHASELPDPRSNLQPGQQQFSCEICAVQTTSQLEFYRHLKCHYEPETVKMEGIRSAPMAMLESTHSDMFDMRAERKLDAPTSMTHPRELNESVVLSNSFVRMPGTGQSFNCIPGIDHEPITDDDSINDYGGNGLTGVKVEQNEFSDPEDMLESGVLDNAQRVVDSYIENGTSEVKNLIDMNESQGHIGDNDAWSSPNGDPLTSGIVYDMHKHADDGEAALPLTTFPIVEQKSTIASNSSQSVTGRSGDLSLIYEINVNEKDFDMIADSSTENSSYLIRRMKYLFRMANMCSFFIVVSLCRFAAASANQAE